MVEVSRQRTAADYTRFMQKLAQRYAEARRIRVIQDNLNTHTVGSFYGTLSAEEAFALSERFAFDWTPKKASWLNMAEIEISVIARQCLGRRIESQAEMAQEVGQLVKERNEAGARVNWPFTPLLAREKLKRHYQKVGPKN